MPDMGRGGSRKLSIVMRGDHFPPPPPPPTPQAINNDRSLTAETLNGATSGDLTVFFFFFFFWGGGGGQNCVKISEKYLQSSTKFPLKLKKKILREILKGE